MTNKIFIGMPTYNGERFIKEAIDSLRAQTYTDWVMLISDDASTDNTKQICKEYAERDTRIKYYRQEKNIGMFPNFKFVLDKADEEYFMWAGHDDVWEKEFLETCINNLKSNKDISIAMTGIAETNSAGKILREIKEFPSLSRKRGFLSVLRYTMQPEILGKCIIMYSLFRTKVMKKIWEIYPQRLVWGADYHFSLAAISHFSIIIDKKVMFKKRRGGFSSLSSGLSYTEEEEKILKNPKNGMFPFGRFNQYLKGHMEALQDTKYRPIVAFLLFLRLPRAFCIHIKERAGNRINFKNSSDNKKVLIHCMGDSHISVFSGQERIQPTWPKNSKDIIPFFKTYQLGPVLAYNLCSSNTKTQGREKLFSLLDNHIQKGSTIMLCFGEIDCRAHLLKQAELQKRNIKEIVWECVDRYLSAILEIKKMGYKILIFNAIPSAPVFKGEDDEFPMYGSCLERNEVTILFNNYLQTQLKKESIYFISIFDKLTNQNKLTKTEYMLPDGIHLNQKVIPLVIEEINRLLNLNLKITIYTKIKITFSKKILQIKLKLRRAKYKSKFWLKKHIL